MDKITLYNFGQGGVDVDASDFHMDDDEVRVAQNVIADPLGAHGGLKNRPGLAAFNAGAAAGPILGGISVPLANLFSGESFFYIGRGPVA